MDIYLYVLDVFKNVFDIIYYYDVSYGPDHVEVSFFCFNNHSYKLYNSFMLLYVNNGEIYFDFKNYTVFLNLQLKLSIK